ncbi:DUF2568 domain-containing protein [Nocardioides KLBMP 9356]|uniref:DUF2568 domain-containing protein n=1 Tax=Nocardioides potassii TaxID=2911371 RepID=A0ABS9H873_9ACTN|nr:DUF2568 domain-containing protein [Nocardioides potassii]MCF6377415.1 DUF2568 domain-containing protein [Nocardioides potassii]
MPDVPPAVGWTILALVFLDEILLVVAAWVAADAWGGPFAGVAAALVVVALWATFASPRAPYGGRVARPVTKVLVVLAACGGLAASGHEGAAAALLAFSVVINALGLVPSVSRLPGEVAR